jgi:hypothetical protein
VSILVAQRTGTNAAKVATRNATTTTSHERRPVQRREAEEHALEKALDGGGTSDMTQRRAHE